MAKVYADLIKKDKKTFSQVPPKLKEQVRQVLIDCGRDDLVTE